MSDKKRQQRNEIYKKRYKILRDLGLDAKTASKLRGRSLDVSGIRINKKSGKLVKNKAYNEVLVKASQKNKVPFDYVVFNLGTRNKKRTNAIKDFDNYRIETEKLRNDTTFTRWGMLTHDPRYKDNTARYVKGIQRRYKITSQQAWYLAYITITQNRNNRSVSSYYKELMSSGSELWEIYK
ncbi:MAG TPA: hypothetical protein VK982_07975 [Bacteroidales bacterium]|nr:hypothetical protein [Bacteroidales bacterium]